MKFTQLSGLAGCHFLGWQAWCAAKSRRCGHNRRNDLRRARFLDKYDDFQSQ